MHERRERQLLFPAVLIFGEKTGVKTNVKIGQEKP